jgi:hypothetical protein
MNNATKLVNAVTTMFLAYDKEADEHRMAAYVSCFDGFPINEVTQAIATALRTEQFMPSPARILAIGGLVVSFETRAHVAFEALGKAVSEHGRYRSVKFSDPILTQTVKSLGGWEKVCDEPPDNWDVHFKRNFIAAYKANCELRRGSTGKLLGIAERENGSSDREAAMIAVDLPQLPGLTYEKPQPQRIGGVTKLIENIGKVV